MICRLCLISLNTENCVLLFDGYGGDGETQLIKMIAKYLHLEITKHDEVSTTICQECSKHLTTFHKYCLHVEQQQSALSNKFLVVEFDSQSNVNDGHSELQDPMELQLKCEPEDEFMAETTLEMRNDKDNFSFPSTASGSSRNLGKSTPTSSSSNAPIKVVNEAYKDVASEDVEIVNEAQKDVADVLNIEFNKCENVNITLSENLNKIKILMEQQQQVLTKNTLILEEMFSERKPKKKLNFFPIRNHAEMEDIERKLKLYSEIVIINYISETLGSACIEQNLHLFIGEKFLMQTNWDGSQAKFPLKSTKLFSRYVYNAIKTVDQSYISYETSMRKGFRNYKVKSYNKTNYKKTKTNNE